VKLAFATPFSERSAIGQISRIVTDCLTARGHDVLLVRTEDDTNTPPIASDLKSVSWRDTDPAALTNDFDAVFVNFGDHYGYHAGAIELAERVPCAGIFHDFYLYNLFCGWIAAKGLDRGRHDQEIAAIYGPGQFAALRGEQDLARIQEIADRTPMIEWVAARCAAALAHSHFYLARLERSCPGPVGIAHIPAREPSVAEYRAHSGARLTVTTVGIINPNKCADVVIRALAASEQLRRTTEYHLVGGISESERNRLTSIAQEFGFSGLRILGAVDDETLFAEMNDADVLCCLRQPVLEGASASAIEGMKTGRPIVVADAGFYADLPDDLVFKLRSVEPASLRALLEKLATGPELRQSTGERARAWALQHFSAEAYAIEVERLATSLIRSRPLHELTTRVGAHLLGLGVPENLPRLDAIAANMGSLFQQTADRGQWE
jgi:glycosyltransferase involved in cell wall biosynthesis